MNNIKIKPGQVLLGTVLSWFVISFLAYTTADMRGEANIIYTLMQIAFYFSLLLSVEAYLSMLLSWEWFRFNIGTILLLCAPALLYLAWFLSNVLFG
ncbi:hypothetical protein [Pontibacter ruber]|uniref:Uncharacterized protein n=1 Tax=Pontibacter ruber TaxID=1343895 RepID=A0ABW5CYV4_9BACT|nr:hypothetical protein [Pontibacter ruber]